MPNSLKFTVKNTGSSIVIDSIIYEDGTVLYQLGSGQECEVGVEEYDFTIEIHKTEGSSTTHEHDVSVSQTESNFDIRPGGKLPGDTSFTLPG